MSTGGNVRLKSLDSVDAFSHETASFEKDKSADGEMQRNLTDFGDKISSGDGKTGHKYLLDINMFFEYCKFPDDTQRDHLNNDIECYLNNGEQEVTEKMAYRGLIYLMKNEDLPRRYGTLTKNIVRFIFSAPVRYHPELASAFCVVLTSPIRNFDYTIAIFFDSLYQRHHSDPPQLKNIISKCISFILMQLHSESDFVLIFQFFLKCTSMIPGFRGDLWINGILFEADATKAFQLVTATSLFRGLSNPSTMCYGNSVIQMLSKTSLFRSSFDTYCQNEESLGDLHIALKKVFDSLADSLNANAVDASEFIRKSRPFYFEESAHEDAEEYLRHLLNQLQAESTSEISPSYISETFEGCQSRASYCATCYGTERRYQLFGIVWHYGVLATSGHYVWECKMDDQWIMFDDEDVQIANVTKIVPMANLSPYILNASKVCEIVPATPPYRGLKNSSAICYGNSVIQMLSKTSLFRSSFDT
ncbi:unnamed protein product, partial [Hymenolepis diminuta]|uniref:USP domain-containing protein n=1 Tax=Hymenolepis diminuta TaxID=6216 RepID=A0A0R3SUV8_HYMDI